METCEITVADLESIIDRLALSNHWIDESPVFAAVADALDGTPDESFGPLLLRAIRKILELRVADPQGFDLTCLKLLCPDMTHDDLAQAMTAMGHAGFGHRARSSEAMKSFVARFPQFGDLMDFDRRGGDREKHGVVSGAKLLDDYTAMRTEEMARPMSERLRVKGHGGIYHKLACRYGIRGRDGKPSWLEVENRLKRWKKSTSGRGQMAVNDRHEQGA